MSGRHYYMQSWVKCDEDDPRRMVDPDSDSWGYSGEQIGDRKRASNRAVPVGFLPDGRADIASASDRNEAMRDNPLLKIDPAFKVITEYADKSAVLRDSLDKKLITKEQYTLAQDVLDGKLDKAYEKLNKLQQYAKREEDNTATAEPVEASPLKEWELIQFADISLSEQAIAIWFYENGIYKNK